MQCFFVCFLLISESYLLRNTEAKVKVHFNCFNLQEADTVTRLNNFILLGVADFESLPFLTLDSNLESRYLFQYDVTILSNDLSKYK